MWPIGYIGCGAETGEEGGGLNLLYSFPQNVYESKVIL